MPKKTKIDWCDITINPVVGCKRGCPYCYARRINDRFHFVKKWDEPELKPLKLATLTNRKPVSVFADSMSDPEYWTEGQTAEVIAWMKGSNYNAFILLTKSPKTINAIRARKDARILFDPLKQKLFLGYSCGSRSLVDKALAECPYAGYDSILDEPIGKSVPFRPDFLSVEPLEEDVCHSRLGGMMALAVKCQETLKLIIIGAETGNRKGKAVCQKNWVSRLVAESLCSTNLKKNCRVFMKESLRDIMGSDFRQDRLPWPCHKQREDL